MRRKTERPRAFGCENRERGKVLLDCGATDTVGSVEAIIDKSQEAFEADPDFGCQWTRRIGLCKSSVMPSGNKRCPRSE